MFEQRVCMLSWSFHLYMYVDAQVRGGYFIMIFKWLFLLYEYLKNRLRVFISIILIYVQFENWAFEFLLRKYNVLEVRKYIKIIIRFTTPCCFTLQNTMSNGLFWGKCFHCLHLCISSTARCYWARWWSCTHH